MKADESTFLIVDSSEDEARTHKRRSSIFSESALRELEEFAGEEVAELVAHSPGGYVLQSVAFFITICAIGLTPALTQLILWDPIQQQKVIKFIPQTLFVVEFGMSIVTANIIALVVYGWAGVRDCWNWKGFLYFFPAAFFHGASEVIILFHVRNALMLYSQHSTFALQTVEIDLMKNLEASTILILRQLKLPLTATIRLFLFQQRQSSTQAILILSIPLAVYGYVITNASSEGLGGGVFSSLSALGLCLALFSITTSVSSGLCAEAAFRNTAFRYIIQVGLLRLASTLVMLVICVLNVWRTDDWDRWFFGGWNWSVFALCLWIQAKDFLSLYVVKKLNAFWVALATSAGLCVAYASDLVLFGKTFHEPTFIFIILISMLCLTYALTKKPNKA